MYCKVSWFRQKKLYLSPKNSLFYVKEGLMDIF